MEELNQNLYVHSTLNSWNYYFYHLLETEMLSKMPITYLERELYRINDKKHVGQILYKLIFREKRNINLRLLLIKTLIKDQQWKKAIKWSHRTLPYTNSNQKKTLFYFLSKIFYILNRNERSIQYINLCLKLDPHYKPALRLKKIILLNGIFF